MIKVDGGVLVQGSVDSLYPEKQPVREVVVSGLLVDELPVGRFPPSWCVVDA